MRTSHKSTWSNIDQAFLYDYNIKPCRDCRACKKDEIKELCNKIDHTDILIIGTPICWFGSLELPS